MDEFGQESRPRSLTWLWTALGVFVVVALFAVLLSTRRNRPPKAAGTQPAAIEPDIYTYSHPWAPKPPKSQISDTKNEELLKIKFRYEREYLEILLEHCDTVLNFHSANLDSNIRRCNGLMPDHPSIRSVVRLHEEKSLEPHHLLAAIGDVLKSKTTVSVLVAAQLSSAEKDLRKSLINKYQHEFARRKKVEVEAKLKSLEKPPSKEHS